MGIGKLIKKAQEKKQANKENRQAQRAQNKTRRQEARQKRVETRQAAQVEKVKARQAGKTSRMQEKQETKRTAYENGIDPNSYIGDTIDSVSNVISSIKGNKNDFPLDENIEVNDGFRLGDDSKEFTDNPFSSLFQSPIVLAILAFFGWKLLTKKKRSR